MTSGAKTPHADNRRPAHRAWGAQAWLGLLLLGLAALPVRALEVAELMALLTQVRSGEARFTEQRQVKGLDAPLVSSGTLAFAAPDRFVRKTLAPRAESMAVEGNIVTLVRAGKSRSFALDASPEMEAIVESVRGTLTGNADSLRQHFQLAVSGTPEQWQLVLLPATPRLKVMLAEVRITGQRERMKSVEMRLADGDRSLMQIEPVGAPAAGTDKRP